MPQPAPAPPQPDVPAWPPAGPAAPRLEADENIDPALAAPPPPFWCSAHGWAVCPLHHYDFVVADPVVTTPQEEGTVIIDDEEVGDALLQHPTPAVVEADGGAPLPTLSTVAHVPAAHQVQVHDSDALAFVSAPTGATVFNFGSGANGSSNHAVVDVDAIAPRLPTPTPTPPPSPGTGARRRLIALGVPLASSPSSSRSGTWSPAALRLANGVAPGTLLSGESSDEDEDERGGSASRRR